jgi:GNAT superfamily N-acetyltransferase
LTTEPREVVPTTRQSCRQAAQVLGRAFADEPVSVEVLKNFSRERRIQALTNDFADEIYITLSKGYPLQINEDGKVIAAAVVYPPGVYPLSGFKQWELLIKSYVRNGFYDIRGWMKWLNEVEKVHPTLPHYYLAYVGVEPEHQGNGLGSCILRHLVNKADAEGAGCYLENASPRNVPIYEHFGFQVVSHKEIIGIPTWFMWRPAVHQ